MSTDLTVTGNFSSEQVDLIKRIICKGATDDELALFVSQCRRTGLDPFNRQIYGIKRWDGVEKREVLSVQISIDGLRLIAERTGHYDGQEGPYWCGADGEWVDLWIGDKPPYAAKVLVWKKGINRPFIGIAKWEAFCQTTKDGQLTRFWKRMPDHMLAKCAEAIALRKAFPHDLSGLYTAEEIISADDVPVTVSIPSEPVREIVTKPISVVAPAEKWRPDAAHAGKIEVIHGMLAEKGRTWKALIEHLTKESVGDSFEEPASKLTDSDIVSLAALLTSEQCQRAIEVVSKAKVNGTRATP